MKIIILRHGEAGFAHQDHLRRLTDAGAHKIQQIAAELFNKYQIDLALISPFERAKDSANIILDYAIHHNRPIKRTQILESITPNGNVEQIKSSLNNLYSEFQCVLLVSHLPLVDFLLREYVGDTAKQVYFNPGSYAVIDYAPYEKNNAQLIDWSS